VAITGEIVWLFSRLVQVASDLLVSFQSSLFGAKRIGHSRVMRCRPYLCLKAVHSLSALLLLVKPLHPRSEAQKHPKLNDSLAGRRG